MRANSTLAFPIAVLVHLVWSYFVWLALIWFLIPLPQAVWMAAAGRIEDALAMWLPSSPFALQSTLTFVHLLVFATFRGFFAPRFGDVSAYSTLALAAAIGALLLTASWTLSGGFGWLEGQFFEGLAGAGGTFAQRFVWAVLVSVGAALAGRAVLGDGFWRVGLVAALGRLLAGRVGYDAFLARTRGAAKSLR